MRVFPKAVYPIKPDVSEKDWGLADEDFFHDFLDFRMILFLYLALLRYEFQMKNKDINGR